MMARLITGRPGTYTINKINRTGGIYRPYGLGGPIVLGPELVRNGGFDGNTVGWVIQSPWAYDNNKVTATDATTQVIRQENMPIIQGATYRFSYELSNYSAGGINIAIYGTSTISAGTPRSANGTYVEDITIGDQPVGASNQIRFNPVTTFSGSIDNVSVKKVNYG
jgi:hypothetical protein